MTATTFFETPRLRARSFSAADVEAFVAYRADPDVARYQSWSDYTPDRGEAFVESMQGARPGVPGEWFQLALEARSDGTLVGDLALKVDADEPREAEVGFTLAPAQQGKGYATEALEALLDYAFGTFGLHRVVAVTDALNAPAAALLERVGMRREGHLRREHLLQGRVGQRVPLRGPRAGVVRTEVMGRHGPHPGCQASALVATGPSYAAGENPLIRSQIASVTSKMPPGTSSTRLIGAPNISAAAPAMCSA